MEEGIYAAVKDTPLFRGISAEDFKALSKCWNAQVKDYSAHELAVRGRRQDGFLAMLVAGRVQLCMEDVLGARFIVREVLPGEVIGIFPPWDKDGGASPYAIEAAEDSRALFMNIDKILSPCEHSCSFHVQMLTNLVKLLAIEHEGMQEHLVVLSQRTTRAKLLAYLSDLAHRKGDSTVEVPFSRKELADFLCVDRSAMTTEMGRMQDAGIIEVSGNVFKLKQLT